MKKKVMDILLSSYLFGADTYACNLYYENDEAVNECDGENLFDGENVSVNVLDWVKCEDAVNEDEDVNWFDWVKCEDAVNEDEGLKFDEAVNECDDENVFEGLNLDEGENEDEDVNCEDAVK